MILHPVLPAPTFVAARIFERLVERFGDPVVWIKIPAKLFVRYSLHRLCNCMLQRQPQRRVFMAWTTPTLVEICIGLEINGYLPAEL
jgi:coenzyme PQQ precursor peptide PqqA